MTKLQEEIKALKEMLSLKKRIKEEREQDLLKDKLTIEMIEAKIAEKENEAMGE